MTAVVDDAIKQYERKLRWQRVAEQMERTRREDPAAWAEYLEETALWENASLDGLHDEPIPTTTLSEDAREGDAWRHLAD